MQIEEVQKTPNPQAIILLVEESLTSMFQSEEFNVPDEDQPEYVQSVLEKDLVDSIMVQQNQITVKLSESDWRDEHDLLREIGEIIRNHEVESTQREETEGLGIGDNVDPKMELIRTLLEQEILPYLKSHGGNLNVIELTEEDELIIEYQGACGGCPASVTGTLRGIEGLLKKEVDENITVRTKNSPFPFG